ncbi:hypothetical protein Q5P01_026102 [Channa striata]|uniref:Uncharacterized protein n=1 Tax=Channa striata TaxID=64152 RepID=A0AA88IZC0_CHASR|nr:hypothetical protein Q5P01_026102 [Channa striata]
MSCGCCHLLDQARTGFSCHDYRPSHRHLTQLLWLSTATWEISGPFHLPLPPQRRTEQLVAPLSQHPCMPRTARLSLAANIAQISMPAVPFPNTPDSISTC